MILVIAGGCTEDDDGPTAPKAIVCDYFPPAVARGTYDQGSGAEWCGLNAADTCLPLH